MCACVVRIQKYLVNYLVECIDSCNLYLKEYYGNQFYQGEKVRFATNYLKNNLNIKKKCIDNARLYRLYRYTQKENEFVWSYSCRAAKATVKHTLNLGGELQSANNDLILYHFYQLKTGLRQKLTSYNIIYT